MLERVNDYYCDKLELVWVKSFIRVSFKLFAWLLIAMGIVMKSSMVIFGVISGYVAAMLLFVLYLPAADLGKFVMYIWKD